MEEVELRACLAGLYIGNTLHRPIILETVMPLYTPFLANDCLDRPAFFFIDLKKEALRLKKLFQSSELIKIKRQTNLVAHEITKFSFDSRSNGFLVSSVPPFVRAEEVFVSSKFVCHLFTV